jgi:hypothetical protein
MEVPVALPESLAAPSGNGEPPVPGPPGRNVRPARRRLLLLALGALLAAAVVVLAILAGTYQPVQYGDSGGGTLPGMPAAKGIQTVNTFGNAQGETYVPPQLGVFTITETIQNTGPQPVTIEAVSILSPAEQANQARGIPPSPLTPAGPVRWQNMIPHQPAPTSGTSVAGLSLRPGQDIYVSIPVRLSGTCYEPGSYDTTGALYVKERFLAFTHWVAITFDTPFIFRHPSNPGGEPSQDLTCLHA